jgi:uncharacterized protein (DUF2249 family)/mannose-6-phosphate isomerase-like protein (cupin superfamily)
MQKYNLADLIEYDNSKINPKILINEPGYRLVLMSMRAGQSTPEHTMPGRMVTAYALRGYITFYSESTPCELHAGEVVSIEASAPHRVEAHEDSALLVLATGNADAQVDDSEELDLREIPRPQRHPLIFAKFDALTVGGSLRLLNDHDPVPLNRQFDNIRPGQALWEYIVRGPSLFRIRIRRIAASSSADVSLGAPIQLGR